MKPFSNQKNLPNPFDSEETASKFYVDIKFTAHSTIKNIAYKYLDIAAVIIILTKLVLLK